MRFNLTSAKRVFATFASVCLAASLSACGGGGEPTPYASPAEGFYQGSLSGHDDANAVKMIVLENDQIWALYGIQTGVGFLPTGFVQGKGSPSEGSYISNNLMDYGIHSTRASSMTGSYGDGTIGGTWDYAGSTSAFSAYQPEVSSYNYWQPADLRNLQGTWHLLTLWDEELTLTVFPNGTYAGDSGACHVTGQMVPRASGINVFDMSMTATGTCAFGGRYYGGVAVVSPAGGGYSQLILAGMDFSRGFGIAANGTNHSAN